MGLFGSLHCVAMCGPLLLAVQGRQQLSWRLGATKVLYQLGRILTYGVIGLVLGMVGRIASFQGWQQGLSITTGLLLLLMALLYGWGVKIPQVARLQTQAVQPFVRLMGRWLYKPGGAFIAGILNGILPCGMVYMALASALNAEGLVNSFLFMLLFGLGTLPLLLLFSFVAGFSKQNLKAHFTKLLPILYLVIGLWFILRGANLDIPYLSPLLHVDGAINCM